MRRRKLKSQDPLSTHASGVSAGPMPTEARTRLNAVIRFYRTAVRIGLTLVSVIFVKRLLAQVQYPQFDSTSAFLILQLDLVGYLYCWYYGTTRDLSVHNDVLTDAPKPTWKEIGFTAVIVLGFLFLFYTSSMRLLSMIFLCFLAVNVCGLLYLRSVIRPFVDRAIEIHQSSKDVMAELKTKLYRQYIFGRWQWWRFFVGFVMLILLMSITFQAIPIPLPLSREVVFALLTTLTVLVLEIWIWYERLKLKHQWDGVDWMKDNGYTVLSLSAQLA